MKRTFLVVALLSVFSSTFAQGLVVFANARTTLVSTGATGQNTLIAGAPGSYYFGLLTAPPGTTDPGQFSFAGVYATNSGTAGLFGSLSSTTVVPGWAPATTRSFLVAGWSASLGPGWNRQWMSGIFATTGYFGLSSIGSGVPGGNGPPPSPALPLFGPPGSGLISAGFNLDPVPEPSAAALLSLGLLGLLLRKHGGRITHVGNPSEHPARR